MQSIRVRQSPGGDNVLLARLGAETFSDAFGAYNSPDDRQQYL